MRLFVSTVVLCFLLILAAHSQNLGFDLVGPPVDVKVERAGKTLPISEVPSLQPGDRIWLHPNFPDSQSVQYLLVITFLRGTTNPPPDAWFTKVETWDKSVRQEGIFVTVPKEAQQALIFLAPRTTGDFSSLRTAVRGRPGSFVRSSQDLQQAGFDRSRIERYVNEVKTISENNPGDLQQRSASLARNLKIKLDEKCFDKPIEQQYTCLTHNADQLILDDANSQSMLERVSNGATADLMNQISYSRLGGAGAYSAYIGAIIDFGRIMGSLHTAQYQYIPALAVPRGESLSLRLNNPPSFRKPQSVMVVALPPVRPVPPPKLQAVEGNEGHCLSDPSLVLPTDGPPLLFATQYAHDTFLRVQDVSGHTVELPVHTDPSRAGFVVRNEHNSWDSFSAELTGTIHGMWGFDSFQGPQFKLHLARPEEWSVVPNDKTALIVGREDLLHVEGQDTACVRAIDLLDSTGTNKALRWKALGPRSLEIKLPLEHRKPGAVEIAIRQHELAEPDKVIAQSYEEAAQFDGFEISSGDTRGTLRGKRLDEVRQLRLGDVEFRADQLSRRANHDELILKATAATDTLQTDQTSASVVLIDGRVFQIPASVMPPRPVITLISKGVQGDDAARTNTIHLSSTDEFPSDGRIVFSVKSVAPAVFPRGAKIEVAATDNSFHTVLTMSEGTLVLQDSRTALGVLDPEKTFGKSAFGAIQFRAVTPQGTAGNWQPLGTLVRLPELKQITCPKTRIAPCVLNGTNLFLLRTVSTDGTAEQEVTVPDGFTGQELTIGRPVANTLHLSLRDDPEIKQTVTLPIVEEGGSRIQ